MDRKFDSLLTREHSVEPILRVVQLVALSSSTLRFTSNHRQWLAATPIKQNKILIRESELDMG